MKDCVIIGAGGHARSILSLLKTTQTFNPIIIIDLNFSGREEKIFEVPVVGIENNLIKDLKQLGHDYLFLAIGENSHRQKLFMMLKETGFYFPNLIANSSILKQEMIIGTGNVICEKAYIGPKVKIGNNNIFNTSCLVEHECEIGNHSHIAPNCAISGRTKMGDNVFMGISSTVIDKISICSDVIVGAGGVVVKDISVPGTYVGVPVKRV
jgi:sugar O-acyltransferase (sialic acid O-acetyltransferase NeuD family)